MTIAHIIPDSNRSVIESFVKFTNENFSADEHIFYILVDNSPIKAGVKKYKNVSEITNLETKNIINIAKNNDKVIFHYLKLKTSQMFKLLFYPTIFNKITWVAWGVDLYQWKEKRGGNLIAKEKIRIKNIIGLTFRRKIKIFVGIFPPDIDYFKKEINSTTQTYYASYTGNLYNPLYSKDKVFNELEDKVKGNECINIQIGHSSAKTLNHLEVLKSLEKFKDENIRLYLPLNYGDRKYGDFVEEKAKELFGVKAITIREMLSKEDYMEHLSTIDIAIFNTTRQIGLGNISPMLYMEKKIYMVKGSVMYDFYSSQQIDLWDYNEISNLDYSEFIQPLRFKGGRKYIVDNELDLQHKIDMWNKVFEAPLK